ncbi:DsbA family protein [Pacificimonas sp. WHA3]|uniref:DsbA family protein n=1 Tax=Pacificimonas pallii TaxID=2827236 RepID=A0ABS6SDJ9_9SPHN|nr:thioredoxin domain-containing protein [Pacificimonas pallii]MBV7256494.1 DsbA family protein [Pacificimonas pallii]
MLNSIIKSAAPIALLAAIAGCGEAGDSAANASPSAESAAESGTNWVRTLAKTEEGGFLMGNPDAKVKLVEFGSLACSHCATFHAESMQDLKGKYIASGDVSYELRTFVLNQPDFIATMLARCTTPEAFFALADSFFERQQAWMTPFMQLKEEDIKQLEGLDQKAQLVRFGQLGKLDEFVKARSIPASKFSSCISDQASQDELENIRKAGLEDYGVASTPTFVINDERIDANVWAQVQAALDEAL